jgi:nitrate/TMAO reductase-like tetraheme cytochrome c subunit
VILEKKEPMKRYVLIVVVSLFLLAGVVLRFAPGPCARAQGAPPPAARPTPSDVRPNPAGSVAGQLGNVFAGNDPLNCQGCHAAGKPYLGGELFHKEAHGNYDSNVHAAAIRAGKKGANCLDCHSADGTQQTILPASDPQSTINRANISRTCGKCHEQQLGTFRGSIHGQGQARGINVAATCSDCHGAHNVFPTSDPRSQLSKQNTPQTCAKCHTAILEDFKTSAHHAALARGDSRAPDCATCHTAVSHAKAPATLREFNLDVTERCIGCHERQAPGYRDTFHGQATALGYKPAATCADCHTPHRNLPASDPRSTVNAANRVETCGKCHENANPSFVTYDPHPDARRWSTRRTSS